MKAVETVEEDVDGGGMGRSADDDGVISDDEEYMCPIKEVDLTVPKTNDRGMPAVTFRMWVLGLISCVVLSFVNQFFWYRKNPLTVTSISAQVAVVPLGHLMSKTIPKRLFFKGSPLEFTLNPGPFNVKEHVLVTTLANAGSGTVYATRILSAVKLFYKKELAFLPALILVITTQVLGFGWAGIFRKQLVEAAEMWWPANLIQVSLFRALHVKEKRPKGGLSRNQFFLIALICSFAYFVFPGFLFLMLTTFSWVCWIAPDSVLVNQVGSGAQGMGIGSLGFDWTTISAFLGSPLASPWFATLNILVGFILVLYVMVPFCYWFNVYNAKNFPIYSDGLFHLDGSTYDTDAVIDSNFHLDAAAYQKSGPVYMSTFFTLTYGFGFAALPATLIHVLLFNGKKIWNQTRNAHRANKKMDIHARLMKACKQVPMWWFHVILIVNIAAIIFACEYYKMTLQLPWWGVLLACAIAFLYTLPIGIITATTNQQPGLNIITEYVIGYAYPGHPVANMCFKVYGYISMSQAVSFLADFKLGHYMKIPPRSMFVAQVLGTLVSGLAYTLTAWWLMDSIPNLCDKSVLPKDSPWKCPRDHVFYAASVIWGLVGPQRMFGNLGLYSKINYFFIGGAIAPVLVWLASKAFPGEGWIRMINMPVMLTATSLMPPASAVNYTSWLLLAFLSGYVVFRHWPNKWERYNYILSAGLDAGTAFMTVFMFFALQYKNINLVWWGSNPDGCPLASCPTAKGISVAGCPVFS